MKLIWALLIAFGFRVADTNLTQDSQRSSDDPPMQGRVRVIRAHPRRRAVKPYRDVDVISDDSVE